MQRQTVRRTAVALAAAVGLALGATSAARADSKDTVDDVIKAGRQAGTEFTTLLNDLTRKAASATAQTKPQLEAQVAALKKIQPLPGRLASDRTFAKEVLDLSLKSDKAGLGALWSKTLGTDVQIRDIKDWMVYVIYEVNGYRWEACISSDASCGGKYASHEMLGKAR